MSPLEQCKVYFDRLKELDESGELSRATSRSEVAKAVGFMNKTKGYTWVSNAIRRGRITETLLDTVRGKNVYEYHFGKEAITYYPRGRKAKKTTQKPTITGAIERALERQQNPVLYTPTDETPTTTVIVKYGKVEVVFTKPIMEEYLVKLVKKLNEE